MITSDALGDGNSHVNFCNRRSMYRTSTCSLKLIRRIVRPQIWLYLFSIINKGCNAYSSSIHPSSSHLPPLVYILFFLSTIALCALLLFKQRLLCLNINYFIKISLFFCVCLLEMLGWLLQFCFACFIISRIVHFMLKWEKFNHFPFF